MLPYTEKTNKGLLGLTRPYRGKKTRTKTISYAQYPPLSKRNPSLSPRKEHIQAALHCTKTLDLSKGYRLFDSIFGLAEDYQRVTKRTPRLPLGLWKSQDPGKTWTEPEIGRGKTNSQRGFGGTAELIKRSKSLVFA